MLGITGGEEADCPLPRPKGTTAHRHFGGLQLAHGDVGESPGMGQQLTGMSTGTGHSEAARSPSSGVCNPPGHVPEQPALTEALHLTPARSGGWSRDPCPAAMPRLAPTASSALPLSSTRLEQPKFVGQPWGPAAERPGLPVPVKLRLSRSFGTTGGSGAVSCLPPHLNPRSKQRDGGN